MNIEKAFIELLDKPCHEVKALFIPTALNTPEMRKYVHVFMDDLLKVGIPEDHIVTYDLERILSVDEITDFDVVYFSGGDTLHLIKKVNEISFKSVLDIFMENGGIYVGVSAGSDIATIGRQEYLGYLNVILETHSKTGSHFGALDISARPVVTLTDNQAILCMDGDISVIE